MSLGQLLEYTFGDIKKKQLGITDLFPTFHDRVRQVAAKGGVLLKERLPKVWHFEVASGTEDREEDGSPNRKYDVYVEFKNIYPLIKKHVLDQELWKQDGSGVDNRKLANAIFDEVDLETSCSCPASLFWGPDYIRTQVHAQHGDQEERPPKIKNPDKKGILCKHGDLVFDVLPAYKSTFAKHLIQYYKKTIDTIEQQVRDGEVPDEYEEPEVKSKPIRRPRGRSAARRAPAEIKPGAKPTKKEEVPSPGGSRSATGNATGAGTSSATKSTGSAGGPATGKA